MGCLSSVLPIAGDVVGAVTGQPWIAAAGNAAGSLFGSGPSAPAYSSSGVYQPQNTGSADQTWNKQLNANIANNPYTTNNPQLSDLLSSLWSNPYGSAAQTAANTSGADLNNIGGAQMTAANNDYGAGTTMQNGATQVLNTAFDPQSALYKQSLQNLNDQVNANEAARGITMGGVGSQIINNADAQFNTDWQAQQLANQVSGLNAAGNANVNASNINAQGGNIATQGAANVAQSGALPYSTYTGNLGTQANTGNEIMGIQSNANNLNQQNINDLANYLKLGVGASGMQTNAALNSYPLQVQQSQAAGAGINSLLNYVPQISASMNNGWYGNTYYG